MREEDIKKRRNSLLYGVAIAALTLPMMISGPVYGQDQDAAAEEEEEFEEVIVTGSRIRQSEFSSSSPVQIINMETTSLAGLVDISDILQQTTIAGNASQLNNFYTGFVVDGGSGNNSVDLRGLGAGKTLVLMNGRRLNGAGTRGTVNSVDLNTLPRSIIQRVEILKDGASSIYGSDAVAGVVNIITKTDAEGISGNAFASTPADGGGNIYSADLTIGFSTDDANFMFGVEYFKREGLREGDRDWAQCATEYYFDPDTGEDISMIDPNTGQAKCWGSPANDYVVVIGGPNGGRWIRDPAAAGPVPGWRIGSLAERKFDTPRQDVAHIISPSERLSAFSFGNQEFDVLGGIEGYYEFMYNSRKSSQNSGPRQFAPRVAGTLFGALDPFNPFGDDAFALPLLLPYDQVGNQEVNYLRTVVGARGTLGDNWSWDLYAGYGRSHGTYSSRQLLIDRVAHSLDFVDNGDGTFDCAVNQDANAGLNFHNAGCVPFDPYAAIGNPFPEDVLDYITSIETGVTTYNQNIVSGYVTGDVFDLPHGPISVVVGFEWRKETINDIPSSGSQNGNLWGFTSSGVTQGTEKVKELFGEVQIPLLKDQTLFEELSINASARYTDYLTVGSDETYKIGVNWQLIPQFRVRAAFGTSFRAPALFESFLGGQTSFSSASDPCDEWDLGPAGTPLYNNCASEVPVGWTGYTSTPQVTTFGNAGRLEPETSESLTIGAIVELDNPDIGIAVDYFDITIEGEIARFGPASILSQCYNDPLFRAPGTVCDFVATRDPDQFNISDINDSYFNINKKNIEGMDFTARYVFDYKEVNVTIDARATKIFSHTRVLFGDVIDDLTNQIGFPDWNAQLDVTANWDQFTLYYGLNWIGGMSDYEAFGIDPATSIFILSTPDYFTHDMSVRYRGEGWSAQVGITNFTDKEPPKISDLETRLAGGTAFHSGYNLRGRTFFFNLSKGF